MPKVLLIDDEGHRALSIKAILPADVECHWARTAPLGELALRSDRWDMLLLDHDLYCTSGKNGVDMARVVVETQNSKTCRIFIHSQNMGGRAMMREILKNFRVTISEWNNAKCGADGMAEFLREPVNA
jgi:hypothetical protein